MAADAPALVLLALAWAAYGALHSLLAAEGTQRAVVARLPRLAPAYRLAYNGLATLALVPPVWLMVRRPGPWLWRWTGLAGWAADGLALGALVLLVAGPGTYDLPEFLGLRAWRERRGEASDRGPFRVSTLHRFVRHPWYALGLVVLWTRDMDPARLVSALVVTGYLGLGAWLEERKLLRRFGSAYAAYRTRVPAFLPWRGAALGREEARRLEES